MNYEIPRTSAILAIALFLIGLPAVADDTLAGDWEGAYVRMGAAQVVQVSIRNTEDGWRATYSVPDIQVSDAPTRTFHYRFPTVVLRALYGEFTLHFDPEKGELTGQNERWNPLVTLHLRKRLIPFERTWQREPIRLRSGDVGLSGHLYLPPGRGPHPAVVVVHGSGRQTVEDDHYRFWAELLPQFGVAVLVYDKRGSGASGGTYETASLHDLAGDALSAVTALRKRRDIDGGRIGLVGLSQGGWIAPIAAVRSKDVAFLILVSAPAVSVEQQELDRVEQALLADEHAAGEVADAMAYTRLMFEAVREPERWPELQRAVDAARDKPWFEHVSAVNAAADLERWRLLAFDPAATLARVSVPVLAIYGEYDTVVPPGRNAERMAELIRRGGGEITVAVLTNSGHNLETFGTLKGEAWEWPLQHWVWPRTSPRLLPLLGEWIGRHVRCRGCGGRGRADRGTGSGSWRSRGRPPLRR